MSTATSIGPGQVVNRQATYRRDLNPKDQFGRKWLVVVEVKTMDICGEALPAWNGVPGQPKDPMRTPMNYVRLATTEDGNPDTSRCTVDLEAWKIQQEEATRGWYERLHDNAIHIYKAIDQNSDLEHDRILVRHTGPKPWPSVEVLEAAIAGDEQFLGIAPLDRAHRAALLTPTTADLKATPAEVLLPEPTGNEAEPPDTYQAFVSWVQKKGITKKGDLKAIAQLWADRKAHLAAAEPAA